MDVFFTYILFSHKLNQFYIGSTDNIERRMNDHNSGHSKHTSKGMPWIVVFTKEFNSRTDAVRLEISIKKRGAARYLNPFFALYYALSNQNDLYLQFGLNVPLFKKEN